ncbi:MAG: HAD family hydrolase [Bacillota bacterium]
MSTNGRRRTVLFDLDGTLLPVEMGFFFKHYMNALARAFADKMTREAFEKALLGATHETINNLDPSVGNLKAFADAFTRRSGLDWDDVWPTIQRYYIEDYPSLRQHVPADDVALSVVRHCVESGWDVVLATQPLFPEIAVRERMGWCGVDSLPWRFISTIENMHFCKPHLAYYREVLEKAGLRPDECIMIGNNMQEDMVARKLGMKTFLVEDHLIDSGEDLAPDGRGRLTDVPAFLDRNHLAGDEGVEAGARK